MIIVNQTVSVIRPAGEDKYGEPIAGEPVDVAARVTNEKNKVPNAAGEEVVTTMTVLIRLSDLEVSGLNGIRYDDKLRYTDVFGNTVERVPQNISVVPWLDGKPWFTRVFV